MEKLRKSLDGGAKTWMHSCWADWDASIIKKWDVSDEEKSEFLINMIKETIYENTLVVIQWIGVIKESTPVVELKKSVSELENVYTPE